MDTLESENHVREILTTGGDLDLALTLITEVLATQPSAGAMRLQAMVLEGLGRTSEAIEPLFAAYRALLANPPRNMAIYDLVHATVALAKALSAAARSSEAIRAIDDALAIVPEAYAGKLVVLREQLATNGPLREPTGWDVYRATADGKGDAALSELQSAEECHISGWLEDTMATVAVLRGPEHVRSLVGQITERALRHLAAKGDANVERDIGVLSVIAVARACGVQVVDEDRVVGKRLAACVRNAKHVSLDDLPALALLLLAAGRTADAKAITPRMSDEAHWAALGFRFQMVGALVKGASSPRAVRSSLDAFRWFVAEFPGALASRWGEQSCPRWRELVLCAIVAAQLEGKPVEGVAASLRQSILEPGEMPPRPAPPSHEPTPKKGKSKAKPKVKAKAKAKVKAKAKAKMKVKARAAGRAKR